MRYHFLLLIFALTSCAMNSRDEHNAICNELANQVVFGGANTQFSPVKQYNTSSDAPNSEQARALYDYARFNCDRR